MLLIIGLVIAGILLISFEILVPGGVLGLLGGAAIIGAVWVGFTEFGVFGAGWVFIISILITTAVVLAEFKMLPKTKFGKRIFLNSASGGRIRYGSRDDSDDANEDDGLVGKQGEAATTMAPSGRIVVEGKSFEAFSESGFLERGTAIEITGRDAFRVLVKKVSSK